MYLSKDANPSVVKEILKSAFVGLATYTILDCDRGSNLSVLPIKNISGRHTIKEPCISVKLVSHALHVAISMHQFR